MSESNAAVLVPNTLDSIIEQARQVPGFNEASDEDKIRWVKMMQEKLTQGNNPAAPSQGPGYLGAVGQNIVRVGENALGLGGLPEMAVKAVQPITSLAVRGLGALTGSESLQNYQGFSPESQERFFHPISSGFQQPEGLGPQLAGRFTQEAGNMLTGGAIFKKLGLLAEAIPLTPTIIQAIGAALGGQTSEEFIKRQDPATQKALEAWLPLVMTLAGQVGVHQAAQAIKSVYNGPQATSVANAEQNALSRTPANTNSPNALQEHENLQARAEGRAPRNMAAEENLNTSREFADLVPEAKQATAGMQTGSPELVAAENYVGDKRPDVAADRKTRLANIAKGTQTSLTNLFGDPTEADTAVDAARSRVQTAQKVADVSTGAREATEVVTENRLTQAEQNLASTQTQTGAATEQAGQVLDTAKSRAAQALGTAEQNLGDAKTSVAQYRADLSKTKEQMRLAQERQLAAIERDARNNRAENDLPLDERVSATGEKTRVAMERQHAEVRKAAGVKVKEIDPEGHASLAPENLEAALDAVESRAQAQGRPIPSSIGTIRDLIEENSGPKPDPADPSSPPRKPLTWQNLRDADTVAKDAARNEINPNDRRAHTAVVQAIQEAKTQGAAQADALGSPYVLAKDRAFGEWYRDVIRPFRDGPGAEILRKQPSGDVVTIAEGLLGNIPPETHYDISNGQVLRQVVPDAGGKSTPDKLRAFKTVADALKAEPDGIEALRDFFAHDFYAFVTDPKTGSANPAKVTTYLRTRASYFQAVPELAADFQNITTQENMRQRALQDGNRTIGRIQPKLVAAEQGISPLETQATQTKVQGTADVEQARRLASSTEARGTSLVEAAKLKRDQTKQTGAQIVQSAKDAEAAAKVQADAAVSQWKEAYGSSDNANRAMMVNTTSQALGTDTASLLAPLKGMRTPQARYKLSQIAEPVRGNTQALEGIAASLFEQEGLLAPRFDPRGVGDMSLLQNPKGVQDFLTKYQPFFETHLPQHLRDLRVIAKGFEQMHTVGTQAPTAMQEPSTNTKYMYRAMGAAAGIAAGGGTRGLMGGGIGGIAGGLVVRFLEGFSDAHKLTLVQRALYDPDVSHLLAMAQKGQITQKHFNTLAAGILQNVGGIAGSTRLNEPSQ